jgi:E3 ubiquitin-protein ligase TRIP12
LHTIEEFLWPKVSIDVNSQKAESPPSGTALESKYADDDSQERDSTPSQKADSPSEVLFCPCY